MTTGSVPTPDPAPGVTTSDDGPPGPDATAAHPSEPGRRRRWFWGGLVLLVLTGLVGALFIPTPYYLFEPGSVRPAERRIEVEGATTFRTRGEVLFTTVLIDQATVGGLVRGALDDAIVVKDEEEVYGGQDRKQSQQVNQARMDLSKLVATKVALDELGIPATFTADGARVLELTPDSPAEGAIEPGDVIVAVAGQPVALPSDISAILADHVLGETVPVTVRRQVGTVGTGDQAGPNTRTVERQVEVTLGSAQDEPTRPVLGVAVDPVDPAIDSPVQVQIDSGDVTGPSAGLAWALAVVDRLTPGSLTEGRNVAVTGEILPDGTVGPIGGIVQKVSAVKRAGVELFLYPASTDAAEQRQMRKVAGDDVELRPVGSLTEAIEVLAPDGPGRPRVAPGTADAAPSGG